MNIRDISKPVTAKTLNENLAKRFGERIKLEAFTLEQLYDVRNKIRTSLSQVETNESYDTVQTSDTYQKNKLFLDVLNAEISEREVHSMRSIGGTGGDSDANDNVHSMRSISGDDNTDAMSSISKKGANVSRLANYDWKEDILRIAKMLTSPQSSQKDAQIGSQIQRIIPRSTSWKGLRKFLIKNPVDDPRVKSEINKFVAGFNQEVMNAKYESKAKPDYIDIDGDGDKKEPMKKAAKDAKKKKVDEKAESQNQATAARIALKHKKEGTKPKAGTASAEMMKMSMKDLEDFTKVKKGAPKKKNESINENPVDRDQERKVLQDLMKKVQDFAKGKDPKLAANVNKTLKDLNKQLGGEPGSQGIDADDSGAQNFSSPSKKGPMSPGKKPAKKSDLMKQLGGEPGSQGIDADDPGKKPAKKPASPGGMRAVTGAGGSDDDAEARLNNLPGQMRAVTGASGKNTQARRKQGKMMAISSRDFNKHNAIIENYFRHATALFEGEEDKAELVMASKDMVDRVTGWMEDTAEMQTESMLELADAIRDEMGANESEQFISTVKPALESLYAAMEETRASLTQGVGMLTGEVQPETDMGAEDELPVGGDEMEPTTDMEEPADDFEASAPATGGEEEAGREKRESIDLSRRLGTMLSSKKK